MDVACHAWHILFSSLRYILQRSLTMRVSSSVSHNWLHLCVPTPARRTALIPNNCTYNIRKDKDCSPLRRLIIWRNKTEHNYILSLLENIRHCRIFFSPIAVVNPFTPNDPYRGRTPPLTSKRCILYIYSTNISTEYFKHGIYSPFLFLLKMQFVS